LRANRLKELKKRNYKVPNAAIAALKVFGLFSINSTIVSQTMIFLKMKR